MARRTSQPLPHPGGAPDPVLPGPWVAALVATCSALFLAMSLTPLTNNDIWLHMANGEWILSHGRVPLTDPYSFSAAGNRFYAHEWLAGVIFELVHRAAGVAGLILFKTLLGALALALAARAAWERGARWLPLMTGLGVALVIVNSRFLERPEMFSYVFTALYVLVLGREHARLAGEPLPGPGVWRGLARPRTLLGGSLLWPLVPVQWAWVQIHGYFLTGLALLGLFVAAEAGARLLRRLGTGTGRVVTPRLASGAAALAVMILLGLANPNGWEIYTFPFELAGGQNVFMQTIFEWKATFTTRVMTQSSMFLGFALWLALLAVGCVGAAPPLRRPIPARVLAAGCLAGVWVLRVPLAALPHGAGLPGSAWLWSPGELLARIGGGKTLPGALDTLLVPLRSLHPAGDDIFTLTWLALLGWLLASWRRPAAAGLAALTMILTFLYLQAGEGVAAWLGFLSPEAVALTILALTLGPALLYAWWRGLLAPWELAVCAAFLVLAARQNRNIVNFTLVTLPVVATGLGRLAHSVRQAAPAGASREARPPRRQAAAAALAATLALLTGLTLASGWPYTPAINKRVGLGVGPRVPVEAVRYIQENGIKGRVFNKYAFGAYLIHELFPDTRVYMDSRNDVYGPELYRTYLEALVRVDVARRVFAENDFDYVLVDYNLYPGRNEDPGLFGHLASDPAWVLVYFDDTTVLYLRDNPAHARLIARDGYRLLDPVEFRPRRAREIPPDRLPRYEIEVRRAVERHPRSLAARLMLADVLMATRQPDAAMAALEEALRLAPDNIFSLVTGARLARLLGQPARSRELYLRAIRLRPDLDDIQQELRALEGEDPA